MIKIDFDTKNNKNYMWINLDGTKINTVGKKAVGELVRVILLILENTNLQINQ